MLCRLMPGLQWLFCGGCQAWGTVTPDTLTPGSGDQKNKSFAWSSSGSGQIQKILKHEKTNVEYPVSFIKSL